LTNFLGEVEKDAVEGELSFIGTGDYIDALTPSNRARYRASGLYASARRRILDTTLHPLVTQVAKLLAPMMWRTAVLCQGHHWFEYDTDHPTLSKLQSLRTPILHSDAYLASLLRTKFAPGHVMVNYNFKSGGTYRVLAWHGQGNGQTLAYGLNKLARKSGGWEGIDAILMGHTHKLGSLVETRLRLERGKVRDRSIPLVNSGSYLRAYLINEQTYVEDAGLNGLALGGAAIRVRKKGRSIRARVALYV
jgi:hypothetical protein